MKSLIFCIVVLVIIVAIFTMKAAPSPVQQPSPQQICFESDWDLDNNESAIDLDAWYPTDEYKNDSRKQHRGDYRWRPNDNQARVIGRLAEGLERLKSKNGGWWECGKLIEDERLIGDRALIYAYEIAKVCALMSDDQFELSVWGVAGVILNESGFDRCSLGLYPRRLAYKLGLLKKRILCISHTEDEILKALEHKEMKKAFAFTGVDLGPAQLLSRFHDRPNDYRAMMTLEYSLTNTARVMRNRARGHGTNRPWLYWPGPKSVWYDEKITKRAKRLGARKDEI